MYPEGVRNIAARPSMNPPCLSSIPHPQLRFRVLPTDPPHDLGALGLVEDVHQGECKAVGGWWLVVITLHHP